MSYGVDGVRSVATTPVTTDAAASTAAEPDEMAGNPSPPKPANTWMTLGAAAPSANTTQNHVPASFNDASTEAATYELEATAGYPDVHDGAVASAAVTTDRSTTARSFGVASSSRATMYTAYGVLASKPVTATLDADDAEGADTNPLDSAAPPLPSTPALMLVDVGVDDPSSNTT